MSKNKNKQQIRPPVRQSEQLDKKSWTVKLLAISALVLLGVVIFFLSKEKRTTQAVSSPMAQVPSQVRGQDLVPQPMEILHSVNSVESLPQVTPDQLRASADVILKLENSPVLSTADDREIFGLLKEYVAGTRKIYWTLDSRPLIANGARASAAMAFNCVDDKPGDSFGVGPVQWNTEFVALVFYHELKHAVDCLKYEQKHGVRRDPDDVSHEDAEKVAYAAQVRFFVALYLQGMLPKTVSGSPYGDFGIFGNMQEVWEAILNNRFGQWYRQASTTTGPKSPDPEVYLKVGD